MYETEFSLDKRLRNLKRLLFCEPDCGLLDRSEVMQEGGPVVLAALLSRKHTMKVRCAAASAIIGVATESHDKQIANLEVLLPTFTCNTPEHDF